jgi:hypothetical protein
MTSVSDELETLRAENARLLALLDPHGIDARPPLPMSTATPQPYADQWGYLASLQPLAPEAIESTIFGATGFFALRAERLFSNHRDRWFLRP